MRALQFSPEAIWSQLVEPRDNIDEAGKQALLLWYADIANLLREEGKEQHGHLDHTLHLIGDLDNLHLQLLRLSEGKKYRALYERVKPEIPALKEKVGNKDISDVELFFKALYAVMLYRIKGDRSREEDIAGVMELISPVVAELSDMFRKAERGEAGLFEK